MAQKRTTAMRSALMAGSYARWLAKYNPSPVVAPLPGRSMVPISLSRAGGLLETAWEQGETGQHVCRCVADVLGSCRHPEHAHISTKYAQQDTSRKTPKPWFDTDIEFDRETMQTTVTVCSLFADVPDDKAEEFLLLAEPALWAERVEFFEGTTPGRWDSEREVVKMDEKWHELLQSAKPNGVPLTLDRARWLVPMWRNHTRRPPSRGDTQSSSDQVAEYYMFEHASWDWSPEESGDIMNELKISSSDLSPKDSSTLLEEVRATLRSEMDRNKQDILKARKRNQGVYAQELSELEERRTTLKALKVEPGLTAKHSIRFNYGLHRSLQSRFLSSWVRGGLSIDDGLYEAGWFETGEGKGLLCIRADKRIGFTRNADIFKDYSKLLNLLAPSLASMLMEELALHSVSGFLNESSADRVSAPPVSGDQYIDRNIDLEGLSKRVSAK